MLQIDSDENGTTIVELMIGAALLALVILIGAGFMSRLQKTSKHDQERMTSRKQTEVLFNTVTRDAAVQMNGGLNPLVSPKGLEIKRLPQNASDTSRSYTVRYESSCQPFPVAQQDLFNQVYSPANRAKIYQDPYSCLKSLACQAGRYPVVTTIVTGANPAAYPLKVFPGATLCSTLVHDQVRVVMETVYADPDRELKTVSVLQKVFFLPAKAAGDLDILPN
ncbi:MAG TPA: hypothetical protein VE954_35765 [Oligoflexus sp.]|uniref:hypothetical protein n=1 Tax=Oligoflexus sp. TaxID=1971216 RepID=UPI002D6AC6A2|nr:hypothetical protein [Oligoflexus sp.]HYX38491.1 hypothetical protein [Oligoflexus sp.]